MTDNIQSRGVVVGSNIQPKDNKDVADAKGSAAAGSVSSSTANKTTILDAISSSTQSQKSGVDLFSINSTPLLFPPANKNYAVKDLLNTVSDSSKFFRNQFVSVVGPTTISQFANMQDKLASQVLNAVPGAKTLDDLPKDLAKAFQDFNDQINCQKGLVLGKMIVASGQMLSDVYSTDSYKTSVDTFKDKDTTLSKTAAPQQGHKTIGIDSWANSLIGMIVSMLSEMAGQLTMLLLTASLFGAELKKIMLEKAVEINTDRAKAAKAQAIVSGVVSGIMSGVMVGASSATGFSAIHKGKQSRAQAKAANKTQEEAMRLSQMNDNDYKNLINFRGDKIKNSAADDSINVDKTTRGLLNIAKKNDELKSAHFSPKKIAAKIKEMSKENKENNIKEKVTAEDAEMAIYREEFLNNPGSMQKLEKILSSDEYKNTELGKNFSARKNKIQESDIANAKAQKQKESDLKTQLTEQYRENSEKLRDLSDKRRISSDSIQQGSRIMTSMGDAGERYIQTTADATKEIGQAVINLQESVFRENSSYYDSAYQATNEWSNTIANANQIQASGRSA